MLPLVVHIVFHPNSDDSRRLAEKIHLALNDDPAVPGLRIPTLFTVEDGTGMPPNGSSVFEIAENVFVVVLADDDLNVGYQGKMTSDRKDWGDWAADLYEDCDNNTSRRCVPFQMTKSAWPLHNRLKGVNFPRAWATEKNLRENWVINRLILELVRFLHGDQSTEESEAKAPLTVFVSHTKIDIEQEPKVVQSIIDYLKQDQPVNAWVDSGDIDAGSRFAEEIEKGIKDSALLSILTDAYSSREWCREEVLLAKENQRPVVVVDALQSLEMRSFPYGGNAPVIRWNQDPKSVLNLLFKEVLRQQHTKMMLEQQKQPDDIILTTPPEMVMIVGRSKNSFLYPDPPLGEGEIRRLARSGAIVETPLQRFAKDRPLDRMSIALSLSESSDTEKYGLSLVHFDQMAIEISRYLLLAGATLCYGGHLGSKGYTVALFELVKSHPVEGVQPLERIQNYVGWPLPLELEQISEFKESAVLIQTPRPADISEKDDPLFQEKPQAENLFWPDSGLKRFAWARGMTLMRKTQSQDNNIKARIVLGGKIGPTITAHTDGSRDVKWYNSRIPGVIEEILCSIQSNQPVYLVGGFGGCARMAADLIQRKPRNEMRWDFHKDAPFAPEMRKLYESRIGVTWWGYTAMTQFLHNSGIQALKNGLTEQENLQLFGEQNTYEIVRLLLKGLKSLQKS